MPAICAPVPPTEPGLLGVVAVGAVVYFHKSEGGGQHSKFCTGGAVMARLATSAGGFTSLGLRVFMETLAFLRTTTGCSWYSLHLFMRAGGVVTPSPGVMCGCRVASSHVARMPVAMLVACSPVPSIYTSNASI